MALVIDLGCGTGRFSKLMAAHSVSKWIGVSRDAGYRRRLGEPLKIPLRADSFLARLSDDDFQQGMAALRTLATQSTRTMQLSKKLIGSCLPYRMSKLEALQMSSFASRAFEMAMPPRRSSLPSRLRSVSLTTETPLRQRARSREMPSSNRPRVGPPRSPASSSDVPRSRTVACVPCSRTAEPIHLSHVG